MSAFIECVVANWVFIMSKSVKTNKIALVSEEGTGVMYVTKKNFRKKPEKLRKKKYDRVLRKHVMFVERKLK